MKHPKRVPPSHQEQLVTRGNEVPSILVASIIYRGSMFLNYVFHDPAAGIDEELMRKKLLPLRKGMELSVAQGNVLTPAITPIKVITWSG
jgi:hypothetical protein